MHRNIFRKTTSIEDKASTHKNKAEGTLKTQKRKEKQESRDQRLNSKTIWQNSDSFIS